MALPGMYYKIVLCTFDIASYILIFSNLASYIEYVTMNINLTSVIVFELVGLVNIK